MDANNRTTVVGVFRNTEDARNAISALKDAGFSSSDVGLLMRDRDQERGGAGEGNRATEGAVTGLIGGGALGGLAGWLAGIGAIAIPGVGPFVVAGALATAFLGATLGATVGAIAGALAGMGIPEEEAEWYEGEVRSGRTLVTVKTDTRYDEARTVLRNHGAYDIEDRGRSDVATTGGVEDRGRGEAPTTAGANAYWDRGQDTGYRDIGDEDHRARDAGHSDVEEEDRGKDSPLMTAGIDAYWNEGQDTGYRGLGGWDEVSPRYRERWQERHGTSGRRWEDDESGYRYGWEMRTRPEHRERSWREAEPELRRDWETRHPDRPWSDVVEPISLVWQDDHSRGRGTDEMPVRPRGDVRSTGDAGFEIVGGEGFPDHEHNFAGADRCAICGATRRPRRAA